jgi:ABC-type bacteriocin/lantibiotic exporter with double-glycine peptidase domain
MTTLKRYINLLNLDKNDIYQVIFYAIFAGIVSLSLPLGIQAIINLIQGGRVSFSWIVLVVVVILGVALVGILSLMQLRITENIQQKIFIRSSFEFTRRFPQIKQNELYNNYPQDLANRFFDTINIQKGTSKLLIDFSSAILQITFGILLLSLYHPFFILFGFMLFVLLYSIFRYSFLPGLNSSLKESKYKYKVASWIQEIARNNTSFKRNSSNEFALQKNDRLVSEYLGYRESHFSVLKKQFKQLIFFKILITTGLLSIGGYLVLKQQMNIGQFVAAEIIILLVLGSVEKIILGLETLYDVLTSVEKIGQVADLEIEEKTQTIDNKSCYTNLFLELNEVNFSFPDSTAKILNKISFSINQGEKIYLEGDNASGKTTLIRILSGLLSPTSGLFYINDDTFKKIDIEQYRSQIGTIVTGETPFEGTILENITFNDPNISGEQIKWALDKVKLTDFVKSLPKGLDTKIFPEGKQLSSSNGQKILLARSIINKPKLLFFEDPLNKMDEEISKEIIDFIMTNNDWSVVVASKNDYWKQKASRIITIEKGKIISDNK